ncbi:MAG: tetratricopeptide repeat protein [Alphaproteobacteria bacterium]|nr:tetratricopeptide repeat protein [Alphaproteobacteria bacterium]MCL2505085.1 tetratricopeptide repeat protein [Alphaproteobacteria bacterium]
MKKSPPRPIKPNQNILKKPAQKQPPTKPEVVFIKPEEVLPKALEALNARNFSKTVQILSLLPTTSYNIQHFLAKGFALLSLNENQKAAATFLEAAERFPNHATFWFNLGLAQENLGNLNAAISSYQRSIFTEPNMSLQKLMALGNIANIFLKKNEPLKAQTNIEQALSSYDVLSSIKPLETQEPRVKAQFLNTLSLSLMRQGLYSAAIKYFLEAHKLYPASDLTLVNLAIAYSDIFDFKSAHYYFAKAMAIKDTPTIQYYDGLTYLLEGDYKKGFPLLDKKLQEAAALKIKSDIPVWKGEDISGKSLLIVYEQGLGDVIHFARYHALLPKDCELFWVIPKSLAGLLKPYLRGTIIEDDKVVSFLQNKKCDFFIPMFSICSIAGYEKVPPIAIKAKDFPEKKKVCTLENPNILKVGLIWQGSGTNKRDFERSIPLGKFSALFENKNIAFYAPFKGYDEEGLKDYPIESLNHEISDFTDAMRIFDELDIIITVDTASVHLAGSMGKKTFLLLPKCPDWRWGIDKDTTDLYPSVTILRQEEFNNWDSVIARLVTLVECVKSV